jgi:hypothetical protein
LSLKALLKGGLKPLLIVCHFCTFHRFVVHVRIAPVPAAEDVELPTELVATTFA